MESPRSIKDVQKLTGRVATLGRFISKSGDKCLPFFKSLKKVKDFEWTEESHEAFEGLEKYMVQAPLLDKPTLNETLYLYLTVSENALSAVLAKEEFEVQKPVYYGIPRILVIDNGTQFNNEEFRKYCEENEIDLRFNSISHPQANWQAEVANHIILNGLKKRIEKSQNIWVDEVLPILRAYRTTSRVTTGATPFMLTYGEEAVVPLEISHSSPRIQVYNAEENEEGKRLDLDLIDEVRDAAHTKIVEYQKKASFYYNLRVKERFFKQGDLVLRKVEASGVGQNGKLSPN
ncbi:uncharacterized protein LOC141674445 [Apium graveolens]|uniref:uncharacterized protein LOC141674445 n=1 Tax=Apium graveolens TaxID=4045 RepID=UPI003D7AD735